MIEEICECANSTVLESKTGGAYSGAREHVQIRDRALEEALRRLK